MSEIVWTELEGEPLRWPYGQVRPAARKQILDATEKSFSEPLGNTPRVSQDSSNGSTAIYGNNWAAQHFVKLSYNTMWKIAEAQLYMAKVGSPPNPLVIEVYEAVKDTTIFEPFMGQRQTQSLATPALIYGQNVYADQIQHIELLIPKP